MEQAERDRSLGHRRLDGAFAGDAETTSAALLKFPLQPARSSELTISYRFGLLSLDCGRIVPALRDPQPVLRQPQQGRTHRLVLSAVCGVKTCSCTMECAPDGGQVQAALLTGCWACRSSYCAGLR